MKTLLILFLSSCSLFAQLNISNPFYVAGVTRNVASAFVPSSLGLSIEYDVDMLGLSDGSAVSSLTDQSSNARHAIQPTAGNQPVWTNNSGAINNRGFLWFDGTADYLQTNFTTTLAQSNYMWLVIAKRSTAGNSYVFDGGSDGTARHAMLMSGAGRTELFAGAGPQTLDPALVIDTWYLMEIGFNGANSFVLTNGVAMTNSSFDIGSQGLKGITLGARYTSANFNECNIAYLAIKNGAITATERTDMRTYLKARFGTP